MMGLIKKWLKMLFKGLWRERIPQDEGIEKPPLPFTAPDPGADAEEMDILHDYAVTDKWHKGWSRETSDVAEVVIHHTDGNGDIYSLKKWMLDGEMSRQYKKGIGLFHFAIDKSGRVWQAGPLNRWWYHSCSGRHDRVTVGVELIHKTGVFTDRQYESLARLLYEYLPPLCRLNFSIVSHDHNYKKYSGKTKGCPGPDFDWKRLQDEMIKRDVEFNVKSEEEYEVTVH